MVGGACLRSRSLLRRLKNEAKRQGHSRSNAWKRTSKISGQSSIRAQSNLGAALLALGERESGTARLEEAVAAYRAALEELTRDRVPLDWATTQMNLGIAHETLGERESGTARLEQAVAAYRAALEERTRERVPLDWAATTGNQGVDVVLAEAAVRQIETAYETTQSGGQEQWSAYYRAQLPRAQAIRDRLKGQSGECNTVNCGAAAAGKAKKP